jgi:hypothetical protein
MSQFDPYSTPKQNTADLQPAMVDASNFHPIRSLDFVRLVKSPFASPNWFVNLVWMFVCELLAMFVIGQLIHLGYAGQVAIARSGGRDRVWPDFEIDRFGDYLLRGLWPFLWQMILAFGALFVVGLPLMATIAGAIALGENNQPAASMIVAIVGGAVTAILLMLSIVVTVSVTIKSLLGNSFASGLEMNFHKAFVGSMIPTLLLTWLMLMVLSIGYSIVGMLLLCIGTLAVGPMLRLVMCDLLAQLHDIHLSRGGPSAFPIGIDEEVIEATIV